MRLPAVLVCATLALSACGSSPAGTEDGPLDVVVGLYPYAYVLERVGGDDVEVRSLAAPGGEPHDLELTPQQAGAVAEADLVVRSRGFQPALDDAVEQSAADRAVDVLELVEVRTYEGEEDHAEDAHGAEEEGHDHTGEDPHVWLDPSRLATIADALADELAELAPESADGFRERAAALRADLEALDDELRTGLARCERREVVTAHDAFGYLTERYDLVQLPVARSPEEEPSPRQLAEVAQAARDAGVTTVFAETPEGDRVVQQVAREAGAQVAVLRTLETPPDTGDLLTAFRADLQVLRTGLGCA